MSILWSIFIGLLAGGLAKLVMPGRDPGGTIVTIALGIAGSLVATFLGRAVGWYREGDATGFIGATLGAILLLAVYRMFKKKSA
jgi:uncharacterized membrane protein YeaQ/YmgE (transglycosylase-associated protein family)